MKRFYFTDRRDERSRKGDRILRIYKLKNGTFQQIAHTVYRPGMTKGAESEVFAALMKCNEIPRKWENSSLCAWRGPGYFDGEVRKYYSIQEIY